MKLAEPGMASVASATIRNSVASTGARKATPPMSRMSSDPVRSCEQGDDEEERRDDQAVVDHLQQRALRAGRLAEREDAERDEAELRDRRVAEDQARVRDW